jgi:hypothetical protein
MCDKSLLASISRPFAFNASELAATELADDDGNRVVKVEGEMVVREAKQRPFSPASNSAHVPLRPHWTQNPYAATNTI